MPSRAPMAIDRAGDARLVLAGLEKPAVLSRAALRGLSLLCLLAITYGTLGPLGLRGAPWLARVAAWRWRPPWASTDLNDIVTNIVVYLPVGVALRLLVRRRGLAGWPDFCLGVLLSALLSYTTEVLQQAMPARSSNMFDVCINTLAAAAGCAVAVRVQRWTRRSHARLFALARVRWQRWALLASGTAALAGVLMTMPWHLGTPAFTWDWQIAPSLNTLRRGVLFAACGFFAAGAIRLRGGRVRAALVHGVWPTSMLAVSIELAQTVCRGHVAAAGDALSAALAGAAGCVAGVLYTAPRPDGRALPLRGVAAAALTALVLYRLITALASTSHGPTAASVLVHWAPFQAEFVAPFWIAASYALEQFALCTAMALMCLFALQRGGQGAALLLVLGCAAAAELLGALQGTGACTTPVVLAAAGWLAAVRIWRSLFPALNPGHPPHGRARARTALASPPD